MCVHCQKAQHVHVHVYLVCKFVQSDNASKKEYQKVFQVKLKVKVQKITFKSHSALMLVVLMT